MTTAEVIRDVSNDLNDQEQGYEYTRWTVDQLYSYFTEAYALYIEEYLLSEHEKLFRTRRVVTIPPNADWMEACDCEHIVRVLGEATQDGRIIRTLQRVEDSDNNTWFGNSGPCVRHPDQQTLRGYTINEDDDSLFKVTPKLSGGQTRYVVVDCYTDPEEFDRTPPGLQDVPAREFVSMAKQWMLYRALMVDSENNSTIISVADKHRETFFALLKDYRQRKQQEKENEKERRRERERNAGVRAVQNRSDN